MYDLLQHTYTDALILGHRKANERNSLCKMIERSQIKNALLILDRGYESYNLMAHALEKGWHFLIRIQDVLTSRGIAAGLDLPDLDEFDVPIDLSFFTKQTNELKKLFKIEIASNMSIRKNSIFFLRKIESTSLLHSTPFFSNCSFQNS